MGDVEILKEQVSSLKSEMETMRTAVKGMDTPWYLDFANLTAGIAILFSFGTTYVSYRRTMQQDIHDARIELRGLVRLILETAKSEVELQAKYGRSPELKAAIGNAIRGERALIVKQAHEIIKDIPEHVYPAERVVVGRALAACGLNDRALKLLQDASQQPLDPDDMLIVLRERAALRFKTKDVDAGRTDFKAALEFIAKSPAYTDLDKATEGGRTELMWAKAEAAAGNKEKAQERLKAFHKLVPMKFWSDPEIRELRADESKFRQIDLQ